MRVIAGTAKGMKLLSPSSEGTRPISARGKEALFSILQPRLPGSSFLDLFAGTGGAGIEALSRGASTAVFVELTRSVIADLRDNLVKTRLDDRATVISGDAFDYLARTPAAFDIIFVAPPQWQGLCVRAMLMLDARPRWLADDGVIVTQHDPKEDVRPPLQHFAHYQSRAYGGVHFGFYQRTPHDGT